MYDWRVKTVLAFIFVVAINQIFPQEQNIMFSCKISQIF